MPTEVRLGNPSPMMQRRVLPPGLSDEVAEALGIKTISVPAPHLNQSVTTVGMREGFADEVEVELALSTDNDRMLLMIARELGELRRYAVGISELEQIMAVHAGGAAPTWASCPDDLDFETAIAQHFRCARGEPVALLTNLGRDDLHAQHLGTAAQPAAYNYVGLTANATAANASNTSLPAEITTAGGGLIRKQATHAHTAGTNTSTLTVTFTVNASDTGLPVVVAKIGVFKHLTTAATMGYETLINATATLTIIGDNVTITETVTAG
jgi:hypothetical protein